MSKRTPLEQWNAPVEWSTLPETLTVPELCPILRCGRREAYRWAERHPGLVIRLGGSGKRVSRDVLRRFLDRDPDIVALAATDPYAPAPPSAGASFSPGSGPRARSGRY